MNLARLLLAVLPCIPGLIFLVIAFLQDPAATMEEGYARAAARAQGLYKAGAVTLLGGTLGTAAVIWKIARTRPEDEEADARDEGI